MNYLAHAWTLPAGGPDLVLGAALPDLLGAFDRRAPRLGPDAVERLARGGAHELARGVRAHQVADACFHGLDAFRAACDALAPLSRDLVAHGARVRGFFVSHLLVEMLLDAELVAASPDLGPGFYAAISAADRPGAARALEVPDAARFVTFTERFLAARFLLDYATDEGVALRLEQVLLRARQHLGDAGRARLVALLPDARVRLRALVPSLTEGPRRAVREALARDS